MQRYALNFRLPNIEQEGRYFSLSPSPVTPVSECRPLKGPIRVRRLLTFYTTAKTGMTTILVDLHGHLVTEDLPRYRSMRINVLLGIGGAVLLQGYTDNVRLDGASTCIGTSDGAQVYTFRKAIVTQTIPFYAGSPLKENRVAYH